MDSVGKYGIIESGDNWVKFGNGLLIQWGITGEDSRTYPVTSFYKPYTKNVSINANILSKSDSYDFYAKGSGVYSYNLTSFTTYGWEKLWIAIGY